MSRAAILGFVGLAMLAIIVCVAVGRTRWIGGGQARVSSPPLPVPMDAEPLSGQDRVRLYSAVHGPGTRGVVLYVLGPELTSSPPYPQLTAALHAAGFATAIVHGRGTGYSDGLRGDTASYSGFLSDFDTYLERLTDRYPGRVFLFGHSLGGALALELSGSIRGGQLAGVVLVNPAFRYRPSAGMGPSMWDYLRFAFNMVVRPAALTMDANSTPSAIEFAADRQEAEAMQRDQLPVRYFSMRYKLAELALLKRCLDNAGKTIAPVLLVQGEHDTLIDPLGNDELLSALASREKKKLLAPGGGHGSSAVESLVGPIVRWLILHAPES